MIKISLKQLGIMNLPSTKHDEVVGEKLAEAVSKKWNLLRSRLSLTVHRNQLSIKYGRQTIASFRIEGDSKTGYFLISD